jgi:hypothetical protein
MRKQSFKKSNNSCACMFVAEVFLNYRFLGIRKIHVHMYYCRENCRPSIGRQAGNMRICISCKSDSQILFLQQRLQLKCRDVLRRFFEKYAHFFIGFSLKLCICKTFAFRLYFLFDKQWLLHQLWNLKCILSIIFVYCWKLNLHNFCL